MLLEILTLSNYASNHNGAVSVQDTFDSIIVQALPSAQPAIYLTAKFRMAESEVGEHNFHIIGRDPSGKEFMRLDGKADVKVNPEFGYSSSVVIIPMFNVPLPLLGRYTFEFYFDDEFQSGLSMHVMQKFPDVSCNS